jgi:D-serine deaminase-like pyridoxal phosphate-dependent protein
MEPRFQPMQWLDRAIPHDDLPTPCLLVDLASADRNIATASSLMGEPSPKLRPHFKAHKCTKLLRRQMDAGNCVGVTCATAWEAVALAEAGFADILIANQVVDGLGLSLLCQAATKARLSVAVDDVVQVDRLDQAALASGVEIGVLIEIDVGLRRSGLEPESTELPTIAREIDRASSLRLLGFQGYEGHAVMEPKRSVRKTLVVRAAHVLERERERLTRLGFDCEVVSGGGTGTLDLAADVGVLQEVQAGSYVLMDARYAELDIPFVPALYCCATVLSRHGTRVVLNAGLKSLSAEHGAPAVPGMEVLELSDEHVSAELLPGVDVSVGDQVLLIPNHIDPTINLHDVLFVLGENGEMEEWPVDGRRAFLHRYEVRTGG